MVRGPDALGRHRIPLDFIRVAPRRSRAWLMVGGAADGRIALLDVADTGSPEGVREYALSDAV